MLLSFRVENHKSIREEQQLLLTPVYDDARPQEADWKATTVAGIFGANASGKSNLLDALELMRNTVRWSMSDNEPGAGMRRYPFALEADARNEPATFVVDLMLDGVRHTYGFSIDDDHVVEEWLYSYPRQRRKVVFERDEDEFVFGDKAQAKRQHLAALTGRNILYLTVAARAEQEEVAPVYRWFSRGLVFAAERRPGRPEWLRDGGASKEQIQALEHLLRSADTGIHVLELHDGTDDVDQGDLGRFLSSKSRSAAGLSAWSHRPRRVVWTSMGSGKTHAMMGVADWAVERGPTLLFHHGASDEAEPLLWEEESLGTRALVTMGFEAHRVLETGGVLVVDEIDASLHPYLSAKVISLFQDEEHNPKGAQLIFTSHDAALLGRVRGEEVLKRDHIWFVDKDDRGQTSLYPLSDFKPRGDDNRARRYLTGRYGAVPDVDDELFQDALRRRERKPESEEATP